MNNDFRRIEAGLVRDRFTRILGCAREREGFRAVEGGGLADFADLVRIDLCDRPSDDGSSDTPQGELVVLLTPRRVAFAAALALAEGLLGFAFEPGRC